MYEHFTLYNESAFNNLTHWEIRTLCSLTWFYASAMQFSLVLTQLHALHASCVVLFFLLSQRLRGSLEELVSTLNGPVEFLPLTRYFYHLRLTAPFRSHLNLRDTASLKGPLTRLPKYKKGAQYSFLVFFVLLATLYRDVDSSSCDVYCVHALD